MSQSLHQVYAHIVFSTKNRIAMISDTHEKKLHAYLTGIVKNLGGHSIIINGMPDHVHLLIRTSKTLSDSEFIKKLKGSSSKWMSAESAQPFAWQTGYGWFSVSANDLEHAITYIRQQKEHHKKVTFKNELLAFLRKYNIEYNERFLWSE